MGKRWERLSSFKVIGVKTLPTSWSSTTSVPGTRLRSTVPRFEHFLLFRSGLVGRFVDQNLSAAMKVIRLAQPFSAAQVVLCVRLVCDISTTLLLEPPPARELCEFHYSLFGFLSHCQPRASSGPVGNCHMCSVTNFVAIKRAAVLGLKPPTCIRCF